MRRTHTVTLAELELSPAAFEEIAQKMYDAGQHHAFDGLAIDMSGIAVVRETLNICDTCEGKYVPLPPTWKHNCTQPSQP